MAAFRGLDITNDTNAYFRTYQKIALIGFAGESRMEIGYVALNVLISKLFSDIDIGFHVLLFVSSAIAYAGLERWIEQNAESYGVCILAFYFLVNANYMSAVRQSMAIGIVLWSLPILNEQKYFRYVAIVLIACLFHTSAVVALLFAVFAHRKYTKTSCYVLVISAFIATMTNAVGMVIRMVSPQTPYLVDEVGNLTNVIVTLLLYLSLLMLQVFASDTFLQKSEDNETLMRNDFFIYCIVITICFIVMSLRSPALSRFNMYFLLAGLPYISNVMERINNRKAALLIKLVFLLAVWTWSITILKLRPEWQHIWPYHFWWS